MRKIVAHTNYGSVCGFWHTPHSAAFLGIPYAAAPIGELAFTAPAPPTPWRGIRDATAYGPTPQRQPFDLIKTIPEASIAGDDILNLNVFTPRPERVTNGGLPVLVWIHGGGFVAGSPASPWYDGAAFNRDGVVVVTIAYRLGIEGFGWLADTVPNRGILDIIAALTWVRDNISEFGGDPGNVTIAGQSAGAAAVIALAVAPRAAGLFRRGIAASGLTRLPKAKAAIQAGQVLAEAAGVAPTPAGWASVDPRRRLALQDWLRRGRRNDPLYLARAVFGHGDPLSRIGPVVDGDLLPYDVVEARQRGLLTAPLLIGATAHEYLLALPAAARQSLAGLSPRAALAECGAPEPLAEAVIARHPHLNGTLLIEQAWTDLNFRLPIVSFMNHPATMWLYDFSWPSATTGYATHGIDLPFAWDLPHAAGVAQACGATLPTDLISAVHGAWVRFATNGDPGWPQATAESPIGMHYGAHGARLSQLYTAERAMRDQLRAMAVG